MTAKFFTFAFFLLSFSAFSQGLTLKHELKNKEKELPMNREITFELLSDSALNFKFLDDGKIISYTDSSVILLDEREVTFTDFKSLTLLPKNKYKAKTIASPFLIAGIAFLAKGIFMASFEGWESHNKKSVPIYIGAGALVTGIASIPFWGKKKNYKIGPSKWGLVLK